MLKMSSLTDIFQNCNSIGGPLNLDMLRIIVAKGLVCKASSGQVFS